MKNGINIINSGLLLLTFAFYSEAAFSTGITSGLDGSGVVVLISLIFFVFPVIILSIVFFIAKIYCSKRNLIKISKRLNRFFIFLVLALLLLATFLSYGI